MSQAVPPPAPGPASGSERMRLARSALSAALGVPGVVRADAGTAGRFITAGGGERVEGVLCVAAPEGGYELSLRLVCHLVSLPTLGQRVQRAVQATGRRLGATIVSVSVHVADVLAPEEQL